MVKRRLQVFYTGHVQGVGFRYTVKSLTLGYEVTGEIRNLPDGRVELIIEGMSEELLDFAQAVRDSGLGSLIRDEQRIWNDATGLYRGFAIVG